MPRDYQIVDADAHVNPPPTFWAEYLPARFRDQAPTLVHGEDADYIEFEGNRKKITLLGAQAGRAYKDIKLTGRLADTRKGGWMPGERLADMDQDGMDVAVLFGGGPLGTVQDELYMASFGAYNRWLADFCSYAPDRFCGIGYIPMRDIDEAIAMMKEAAKLGFTAVNIPAFPQSLEKLNLPGGAMAQTLALTGDPNGSRRYDDPQFDRFWAAAVDLDMALSIHLGARSSRWMEPDKMLADLVMSKVAMAEPVAIMIFGGVFQRFPKLKFATIESGVGWFAWMASYMDETWKKQRYWTNSPLKETPSFYMDRNVYGSFIHDSVAAVTRNMPGAKNIMWSSDYPHSETTYPNSQEMIDRLFAGIPDHDRRAIIGGTAKKLFRAGDGRAKPVTPDEQVQSPAEQSA
jgi:predicted TIM-barrel fold metal-dependent hydrolase